jgi:hypothetical protein
MLAPETRLLLTDALQPPAGKRVDVAVATTYSLDLTALLLAPMTFALHDDDIGDLEAMDPIKLLEAVRRHAQHTTVFVQAGAIAVPSTYRRILTFAEECVREVTAPRPDRLFHPKIWVLRFTGTAGEASHRLVCLSRNLTFDRSWDTVLVLDEHDGVSDDAHLATSPLVRFLGELPTLTTRPLSDSRLDQLTSLQSTLAEVTLAAPPGFATAELLPLGFDWSPSFPLPRSTRSLVVSPFLDVTTARRVAASSPTPLVLSRPETLDRIGAVPLGASQLFVLQRAAEREVGADLEEPAPATRLNSVPEGLHAKTFIFEQSDTTTVVTGSANATGAGMEGNVEFDVILTGPTASFGVDSFWAGGKEAPGFARLCQPHAPPEEGLGAAADEQTIWEIERYHALLAASGPVAEVTDLAEDGYGLRLLLADKPSPGTTTVWPVTLPEAGWTRNIDKAPLEWNRLGLASITPLFVVSTTAGTGAERSTVAAMLTAELKGDPEERRREALADILRTQGDVLRYLAFLLGDPALLAGTGADGGGSWLFGDGPAGTRHDVVLFEPLVRALADGGSALSRIASLQDELAKLPNADELVPTGWDELWSAVWAAHLVHTGDGS